MTCMCGLIHDVVADLMLVCVCEMCYIELCQLSPRVSEHKVANVTELIQDVPATVFGNVTILPSAMQIGSRRFLMS